MRYESADQRIVRVISLGCLVVVAGLMTALIHLASEAVAPALDPSVQIIRVDWSRYNEDVRVRVNRSIAAGDCAAMSDEYRRATADDVRRRLRGMHGSGPLLTYLRSGLQSADCAWP